MVGDVGGLVAGGGVSADGQGQAGQAERDGAFDGQRLAVVGLAHSDQLLGVLDGHLDRPAGGVAFDQLAGGGLAVGGDQRQVVAAAAALLTVCWRVVTARSPCWTMTALLTRTSLLGFDLYCWLLHATGGNVKKTTRYAGLLAVLLAAGVTVVTPLNASATYDPAPWTALLVPAPVGYDPATSDICRDGSVDCVDRTITGLGNLLDPLVAQCDHNLIFNFFYYRITQAYRGVVDDPDYFRSNAYHNQLDAVFASYYFNQRRDWTNGDLATVSPGWQEAFKTADARTVTGTGDALLAINAHILHDEPYSLDQMGLTLPDGKSAKPDYNKDNVWLFATQDPTVAEAARRFDPAMAGPDSSGLASYQVIAGWREQAWRFAEQLKAAEADGDPIAYKAVEAEMDAQAVTNAQAIESAFAATPAQTAARDAYCMAHHYDA